MKRTTMLILITLLTVSLCACSSQTANPEQEIATTMVMPATKTTEETVSCESLDISKAPEVPEPPLPVADFAVLLVDISAAHKDMIENDQALDTIAQYLVEEPETVNLLTAEEIQELLTPFPMAGRITPEEAAYDVDVLFRAFRSSYGAYYYFGEEAFQKAEAEVLRWLDGKESVPVKEFAQTISGSLSFMRDAHSRVDYPVYEEALRYEYFYTDQFFSLDDGGYYQCYGGEKWYVDSLSDQNVKIEPTLTADGKILYSPILFCTKSDMEAGTATLKNAAGQKKEVVLKWTLSQAYGQSYRTPDYKLIEENGIAYLSIRCFDREYEQNELAKFVASGSEVKDAKLIIFDIRSNGGGSEHYGKGWVERFSGATPVYPRSHTTRVSYLRNEWLVNHGFYKDQGNPGTYKQSISKGKQLDNPIPIVVLVDDTCGSAGESMMNQLRCLDNVIIIGSNSAGFQLCGNQTDMWLPHSNIPFVFGSSLQFNFTDENVDYKGYEPDIWCDPSDALNSVLNMLEYYNLADSTTCQNLKSALQSPGSDMVNPMLRWKGTLVPVEGIFGAIQDNGTEIVSLHIGDEQVTGFEVRSESPEHLKAELDPKGRTINLTRLKSFAGKVMSFTVIYEGCEYTYRCADSTYVPE